MNNNTKDIILRALKISLGSLLAIFISERLHLKYSSSAGIITILSVLNTKKATLLVGLRRIQAFILSIVIAFLVFTFLGYNALAFAIFLLVFSSLCYFFNIEEGIPMNSVLVSHFLLEGSMDFPHIQNEAALCLIGIFFGILVNLYMPNKLKEFEENKDEIEIEFKNILINLANTLVVLDLKTNLKEEIKILRKNIKNNLNLAYNNSQNNLKEDSSYHINYILMRDKQINILSQIYKFVLLLTAVPKQALSISDFIKNISIGFNEYNDSQSLLKQLNEIKKSMELEDLPINRNEFENRARLFHILYLLEEFLLRKKNFVEGLDEKTIEKFWIKKVLSDQN